MSHGVQIANARPGPSEFGVWYWWMGRYPQERFPSDRIAAWLRNRTAVDARVLSPKPYAMTIATGRPNASGFADFLHTRPFTGSGYLDAIRRLEPAALRGWASSTSMRPDDWAIDLPDRAGRWLSSPVFFEPLIRDGATRCFGCGRRSCSSMCRASTRVVRGPAAGRSGGFCGISFACQRLAEYLPRGGRAAACSPAGIARPGRPASASRHTVNAARQPDR